MNSEKGSFHPRRSLNASRSEGFGGIAGMVPGGAQMSVNFIEKLLEGKETLKLRMQIKIPPRVKNLIALINNGGTWPGVVLPHKDGNLVIALTCHAK